ncbi:MAG TPA: VWA domain-containing protein [Thermoanaerobaculia bacterium]|jgi:Ca-activated chloride channel family protein|nr:VWA domain-containing protein [Thermoanaerobaculia bacterium]
MRHQRSRKTRFILLPVITLAILLAAPANAAAIQLIIGPDSPPVADIKGLVDLTILPGIEDARVTLTVDGQKIVDGLRSPWHVPVDFGPLPVEHRIVVTAVGADHKRVQWQTAINKGNQTLRVKIKPVDIARLTFEATVTSPREDPIVNVSVWEDGKAIVSIDEPPYRFTIPPELFVQRTVQVTVKVKSGGEAADFWSEVAGVKSEAIEVRTVPLFVSVVDRNGTAHDDVDQALFKVIDNGTEARILQIGKAFDQPISIALLLDASTSMIYEMPKATRAAVNFVQRTLKPGDRCAVFSIRSTPRREMELTSDLAAVETVVSGIKANGRTALYDAIDGAERELRGEKNRRAIVILTDGGDTSSVESFDEIDRITKASGIPIYVIAYDSAFNEDEPQDVNRLQYLASQTGGFLVTASAENLQARYTDIERDLRAQYAITYQITDLVHPNQWRNVHVMLKLPQLTARTIRGYFAP